MKQPGPPSAGLRGLGRAFLRKRRLQGAPAAPSRRLVWELTTLPGCPPQHGAGVEGQNPRRDQPHRNRGLGRPASVTRGVPGPWFARPPVRTPLTRCDAVPARRGTALRRAKREDPHGRHPAPRRVSPVGDQAFGQSGVSPRRRRARRSSPHGPALCRALADRSPVVSRETSTLCVDPRARYMRAMPPSVRRLVVLGTGTDIGKTHVAAALAAHLRDQGAPVLALKPVETGVAPGAAGPDALRLWVAAGAPLPAPPSPAAFSAPLSPHLAARREGRSIDLAALVAWVAALEQRFLPDGGTAIIETAGGAFSPLSPSLTNIDLALALAPARWLLVVPDRLGVLHDVLATVRAMSAHARPPDALAVNPLPSHDASRGTNAAELDVIGVDVPVVGWSADVAVPATRLLDCVFALSSAARGPCARTPQGAETGPSSRPSRPPKRTE